MQKNSKLHYTQSRTKQFAFEQKVLITKPRERWVTNPKKISQIANHDCPKGDENERAIAGHKNKNKTPTSLSDNCQERHTRGEWRFQ